MLAAFLRRMLNRLIEPILTRAIVALPFIVASIFLFIAVMLWLFRVFGGEVGSLILAGLFSVVGVIIALSVSQPATEAAGTGTIAAPESTDETAAVHDETLWAAEMEMFKAALATVLPAVVGGAGRAIGRNLPFLAALATVIFILFRPHTVPAEGEEALRTEPAE